MQSFLVIQSIQIPINHFHKRKRIPNGQSKKDIPEKLAALGTQDEENDVPHVGVHVYKCKRKQKEQSILDNPET
jgi:hypothetical protein